MDNTTQNFELLNTDKIYLIPQENGMFTAISGVKLINALVRGQTKKTKKSKSPDGYWRRNLSLAWNAHKKGGRWSTGGVVDMKRVVHKLSGITTMNILNTVDKELVERYNALIEMYID